MVKMSIIEILKYNQFVTTIYLNAKLAKQPVCVHNCLKQLITSQNYTFINVIFRFVT
jgi:hypothetical protein